MSVNVELSPALEKFAEDCVAQGQYQNVSDVVNTSLRLLQQRETERLAFVQSLKDAEEESERDGYVTIEEVVAEMEAVIAEVAAEREIEKAKAG
jgi:antitoxin ParD1/3/4